MENEIDIDIIPYDAQIEITVSGGFYERIQVMFHHFIAGLGDQQQIAKVMSELVNREPENPHEIHIMTLLSLIKEIEDNAKKQGKIQKTKMPLPKDDL